MAIEVGDEVTWWDNGHGRGADPGDPDARRRTGIVDAVHRHPGDETQVVAYSVLCSGSMGEFLTTVRPDFGHRLELVIPGSPAGAG